MAERRTAPITLARSDLSEMSRNERIKAESRGLTLVSDGSGKSHPFRAEIESLAGGDGATLSNTGKELSKFFGVYRQQARGERGKKSGDHFFMVRIKNPGGGRLTPRQWLALDDACRRFGDGTLRLTSRQAVQYHGVSGPNLAPLVRQLNREYRPDATLAACGDVNRNVMASPVDALDPNCDVGGGDLARAIAEELAPQTRSYFEVFSLERGDASSGMTRVGPAEPIYGTQYLPRKFKIGIAHPGDNSVDVRTQDIGWVPVTGGGLADGHLWDLYTGGGLGLSHNNPDTAAYLGIHLGRVARDQVVSATRAIAILQKEEGERRNRKQARWKYTIRRLGAERVAKILRERFDVALEDAEPAPLPHLALHLGSHPQRGGGSYYGISVESGRLGGRQRDAVREAVEGLGASVMLTPQQDLILCDLGDPGEVEAIFRARGAVLPGEVSVLRRKAMACPAKPTCGLAMTEAERVLPAYIDALEEAGFGDVDAVIRMTGCPNNCARPPSAEIGIYGYGKSEHVVLVGGAQDGSRLARVLYQRVRGDEMIPLLTGLFRAIRKHKPEHQPVGDFLHGTDPARLRRWIGHESPPVV